MIKMYNRFLYRGNYIRLFFYNLQKNKLVVKEIWHLCGSIRIQCFYGSFNIQDETTT